MNAPANNLAAIIAAKKESAQEVQPEQKEDKTNVRIFHGEFPISVSLMTPSGLPVHFYAGYHATEDAEVIEFLKAEKSVKEVTGKVKLSELPVAPSRNRGRNWASASKFGSDPTVFSPADLLARAVASSNTLSTAAQSNS